MTCSCSRSSFSQRLRLSDITAMFFILVYADNVMSLAAVQLRELHVYVSVDQLATTPEAASNTDSSEYHEFIGFLRDAQVAFSVRMTVADKEQSAVYSQ